VQRARDTWLVVHYQPRVLCQVQKTRNHVYSCGPHTRAGPILAGPILVRAAHAPRLVPLAPLPKGVMSMHQAEASAAPAIATA
jgi:hypothetical protein